jgi:hypothetical protein
VPAIAAQHGVFAGQPGSGQAPLSGAVIQQQQPPQSVYAGLHALILHSVEHMSVLLVPALELVPAEPPDVTPAVPPVLVPPLDVVPALDVLPALPPLDSPALPPPVLSELHAASPTVDDAPVTTST